MEIILNLEKTTNFTKDTTNSSKYAPKFSKTTKFRKNCTKIEK